MLRDFLACNKIWFRNLISNYIKAKYSAEDYGDILDFCSFVEFNPAQKKYNKNDSRLFPNEDSYQTMINNLDINMTAVSSSKDDERFNSNFRQSLRQVNAGKKLQDDKIIKFFNCKTSFAK